MSNGNNNIEELEELLSELEGQENQVISPYSEDEDAVTQLMEAPLSEQEWMVQVTALDRRMMATDQLLTEFNAGKLSEKTLVWRGGMDDWLPLSKVEELSNPEVALAATATVTVANAAPPAPALSTPAWSAPQHSRPHAAPPPPPGVSSPAAAAPSVVSAPRPAAPIVVTQPVPTPQTYTARPVAVDFSGSASAEDAGGMLQSKRAILALGSVALLAVITIGYTLSSGQAPGSGQAATAMAETPVAETPPAEATPEPAAEKADPVAETEPSEKKIAEAKAASSDELKKETKPASADSEKMDEEADEEEEEAKATKAKPARKRSRSKWRKRRTKNKPKTRRTRSRKSSTKAESASVAVTPAEPAKQETLGEAIKRAGGGDSSDNSADSAEEAEAPKKAKPTVAKSSGSTFSQKSAKSALDKAASNASNCQPAGGPSGNGRVRVKYNTSGKVSSVVILTKSFKDTTTGSCVRMLFRRASVPKFKGEAVTLTKAFTIP